VGNRTSETVRQKTLLGATDVTTTATFIATDQLTARGDVTYSYDANGNQTASSAGQALAYNGADQTTSLKRAGGSALAATYAGASQVELATAGTTTFTNTLLGVSAGGTTGYTRDPDGALVGIRGTSRSYYLFDGLGSVVAVTNANGGVTNSYTYDPFGVTTETKALLTNVFNLWRYAGQYQDVSTGLYKMGARYYQPELGRWTQPDPSGQEASAYAYVGGNPVNFVDPSGLYSTLSPGCGNVTCTYYLSRDLTKRVSDRVTTLPVTASRILITGALCTIVAGYTAGVGGIPCVLIVGLGTQTLVQNLNEAAAANQCFSIRVGLRPGSGVASGENCRDT
jgi:RHS repeat-associated protein